MRRLTLVVLALLLGAVVPAQGQSTRSLVLNFTIIQQATQRHVHPPAGDAGDVFSTTLVLINVGVQFGRAPGAHVGTMAFAYTLSGSCGTTGGCIGTTDITTLTKLPGGTITAASKKVPLGARPFVVQVQSGTGAFAGVKGKVEIAAKGNAVTDYVLRLP